MRGTGLRWHFSGRLLGTFAAPVLVSLTGDAFAAEPIAVAPAPFVAPAAPQVLDLSQCRGVAIAQQPALAASRASLTAAVEKQHALDKMRLAALLQRDLPIRRKQAALGVQAGQAALTQAEWDAVYGVTFSYLSALYANEQLLVADAAIEDIKRLLESVQKAVDSGDARREIGKTQVDLIRANLHAAQGRREEAVQGLQRASAALREAMGLAADCPLALRDSTLPELTATTDRDQVVALAISRRGEMAQASAAYQATCFEIEAQKSTFFLRSNTFAIGSDIHANPLPAADYGESYKPGAVGIEMPAIMAGCRNSRVNQAHAYHDRAGAVVEKTRNLLTLEAELTFLRWQEASRKVPHFREAAAAAERAASGIRTNFNPTAAGKGTVEDVLMTGTLSTNYKLQLNQARYQLLLGLAGLERVTAGGFCPGFEAAR